MDSTIAKSPERILVAAAQQANGMASDMCSAYWSVVEGKQAPGVFVSQARDRIKNINEYLDALAKLQPKKTRTK